MSVAIAYAPGVYGTYLEWCLTTLTSSSEIVLPFTNVGNSHLFTGNHYHNTNVWEASNDAAEKKFFRLHPKVLKNESVIDNAIKIAHSNQVVLLYPCKDTNILCLNNFFFKVRNNRWEHFFERSVSPDTIYKNWPVDPGTRVEDIRPWIRREFLSFYLMPFWESLIERHALEQFDHPGCLAVSVKDLLFDFVHTLQKIRDGFDLVFVRNVEELLPYHQENLRLQKFLNHDELYKKIIESVCNGADFDWDPIGLCGESYIQWDLRNRGWEIQCDGLDIFPTNSLKLKELLYPV